MSIWVWNFAQFTLAADYRPVTYFGIGKIPETIASPKVILDATCPSSSSAKSRLMSGLRTPSIRSYTWMWFCTKTQSLLSILKQSFRTYMLKFWGESKKSSKHFVQYVVLYIDCVLNTFLLEQKTQHLLHTHTPVCAFGTVELVSIHRM